ncbi:MAG TPA: LpxD N-terminal domain-containing protein, partial [Longimicrobium sp.]|nr:LpxD N-terminal domain-containing protein [Longimicrobium sp.]
MPELTIAEVASIAEGEVERGDPERTVRGVAPLDEAGPGDLSFVAEARYHAYIHASRAAAVLVARGVPVELPDGMAAARVVHPHR